MCTPLESQPSVPRVIYLYLWQSWGLNLGFRACWQALYHVSHAFSPICSGYFGDRVLAFALAGLVYDPILYFLL
jgi:hypothetical protein